MTLTQTPLLPTRGPPPRVRHTVVRLRGEHDTSTVAALSGQLARAMAHDGADLVIDLRHVRFMDASTVGAIIEAREFLRPRGRSLALRSPSGIARRLIELCDLEVLVEHRPCSRPAVFPEP